jgi:PAS domain S-box-containing protein
MKVPTMGKAQQGGNESSVGLNSPLNAIIASAMEAIISMDEQQRIVMFNPSAEQIFGIPAREVIGSSIYRFVPERFQAPCRKVVERLGRTGGSDQHMGAFGMLSGLRANGEEFPVEASLSQAESGGKKLFTVTLRDITNRKTAEAALLEAEQRRRLAMETADLGFYERDLISNQVTADANWRKIMGLAEGEPGPDFAPKSLFPEDRERILALLSQAYDPRRQAAVGADFRIVRPNGEVRWLAGRGRVVFDDSVQPPVARKFLGVVQDITERKEVELALTQTRALLTQSNQDLEMKVRERTESLIQASAEMEAFCYSLSHDMRSPLRAIVTFTELAMLDSGQQLTDESTGLLQKVITAARRLDQLIQDVLAFSQVSRMKIELEFVDVEQLLAEIITERPEFQPASAEILIERPLECVLGHKASLTQCFTNLLSNAVKFMPPGRKPRVRIFTQKLNDKVRIWVEDNGIGIEAAAQTKIFELFERGQSARPYAGVGAGLAIVSKAVERMGGKVGVESEPGHGSRFWLELRATGQKEPPQADPAESL